MKRFEFLIAFFLIAEFSNAQSDSLQIQINRDVWYPFIKAFKERDDRAFREVHSSQVTRVIQDDNLILDAENYFRVVPDSIKTAWSKWEREIELRFIQRIAGHDRAFEVGYYKTTSRNQQSGESNSHYGKFQVLLRKESGQWKILMDADTSEGANEQQFSSAKALPPRG